jgi:hypothetical protein
MAPPPAISLIATSVADPSKSVMAAITVTSTFTISVTGPSSVTAGGSANYTAMLTPAANSNPSRTITWSVAGTGCAGAACGTISSIGAYAAPSIPPSPACRANHRRRRRPIRSKAASVSVTIAPVVSVSVSPSHRRRWRSRLLASFPGHGDGRAGPDGHLGRRWGGGRQRGGRNRPEFADCSGHDDVFGAARLARGWNGDGGCARSNAVPSVSASVLGHAYERGEPQRDAPASATLALNQRQTFSAQVNNTANQSVAWLGQRDTGRKYSRRGMICAHGLEPVPAGFGGHGGRASTTWRRPGCRLPNPVTITAVSQAAGAASASASVAILPHVVVSVQPANAALAELEEARFTADVTGSDNQMVIWAMSRRGLARRRAPAAPSTPAGLYTAPSAPPSPDAICSWRPPASVDTTQSGSGRHHHQQTPRPFSRSRQPARTRARPAGSRCSSPAIIFRRLRRGRARRFIVGGTARATSCASSMQCITALTACRCASRRESFGATGKSRRCALEHGIVCGAGAGLADGPHHAYAGQSDEHGR